MTTYHAIAGLPRAGSTLLCNILNQNPRFSASSTSPVAGMLGAMTVQFANQPEIKGELATDRIATENKLRLTLRGVMDSWYNDIEEPVVFDKSRGWNYHAGLLQDIYPDGKIICMIRDLRSIAGSIEKQHLNTILLNSMGPTAQTLEQRSNFHFGLEGVIGGPLNGIKDLLERNYPNVLFVQYEDLAKSPKNTLANIHKFLDEEDFEYNFENVEATAVDPDYLYDYKFPHEGTGRVHSSDKDEYKQYIPPELGKAITDNFTWYFSKFEYGT